MNGFNASTHSVATQALMALEGRVRNGEWLNQMSLDMLRERYIIRDCDMVKEGDLFYIVQAALRNPLPGIDPLLRPLRRHEK